MENAKDAVRDAPFEGTISMKTRSLGHLLLAAALLTATSAVALEKKLEFSSDRLPADLLQRKGPLLSDQIVTAAIKKKGCTFYEHINGGGASWKINVDWIAYDGGQPKKNVYGQAVGKLGSWWNDKISSVQCDTAGELKCLFNGYEHSDFDGKSFTAGVNGNMYNLPRNTNDTLSSVQVFCSELW